MQQRTFHVQSAPTRSIQSIPPTLESSNQPIQLCNTAARVPRRTASCEGQHDPRNQHLPTKKSKNSKKQQKQQKQKQQKQKQLQKQQQKQKKQKQQKQQQ